MEKKYKIEYTVKLVQYMKLRSSHPEVFLEKGVLKICSKFTGKRPCQSAVSIKFLCKFIEIALWHWCSPVNLLHIFRTPFLKNTSGRLFLETFVTISFGSTRCRCVLSEHFHRCHHHYFIHFYCHQQNHQP